MGFAFRAASRLLWRLPFRDALVRALGSRYGLRSVLFHDISDGSSPFLAGLGISYTREAFEDRVRFLAEHYSPIDLDRVLDRTTPLPPRPVLVTFDDAYASVARVAAPILRRHRVPALFFVNAGFIGNHDLGLDNLLCYVANTLGMAPIQLAASQLERGEARPIRTLAEAILGFGPRLSLADVQLFRRRLLEITGLDAKALAREAGLYMTNAELAGLADDGVEVGSHAFSHVWCRKLEGADLVCEIGRNKTLLEEWTGRPVRSFSVPYGSPADLTPGLASFLRRSGHDAWFLVQALPNHPELPRERIYRISMKSQEDPESFAEIEVLPRLRALRRSLFRRGDAHAVG